MSGPTPTTPAAALAEQERVLGLLEGITQGKWQARTINGAIGVQGGELLTPILVASKTEWGHIPHIHERVQQANAELAAAAPDLARAYLALLAAHAEALEREAGLMAQVQVLSIGPTAEAGEKAEGGEG